MSAAADAAINDLLADWTTRLRAAEPDAVAIVCRGSFARGEPEPWSDLDLDLIFDDREIDEYRSAFGPPFVIPDTEADTSADSDASAQSAPAAPATGTSPPLHVTIACRTLADRLREIAEPAESEAWAFFLAAAEPARVVWKHPRVGARLPDRFAVEYHLAPQLQDLLECAAKIRNARRRDDEPGARLAARDLAVHVPALVALVNPQIRVETRRQALAVALGFPDAPPGYRDRILFCLGLSDSGPEDLPDCAIALARATIAFLTPHAREVAPYLEPGLAEALADGTVSRVLG